MYIKVYIEDDKLIRESDGSLIATCSFAVADPAFSDYERNGQPVVLRYGYTNLSGKFVELCRATKCSYSCLSRKNPNCRYCLKDETTQGLYAEIVEIE